ncbi:MAG: 50S ribosomal protein L25 [Treponema sp.]|jgi:large subunit ribosomal protein L25|nr:50S ribosomal protein L25 [Treponema sp.]
MAQVILNARNRELRGSAVARRLRRAGRVPGVLYGRSGKAINLDLDAQEFAGGIKGISESTIVTVTVDGAPYDAFVKDTQRNIVSGAILHVDFYEVEKDRILRAHVPLILKGNPAGVREGGILETPLHDIEVECLPRDLPERIEVDISGLAVNQSIHVRDIALADAVKLISSGDQVVALVKYAKEEAAAAPVEEEAAAAAGAAPAAEAAAAPEAKDKK